MSATVELASLFGCPSDKEEFSGFRETELVPMETTSEDSSDSCTSSDHFSSGSSSVGQVRSPEETACMRELAKLFQDDSDAENDTFHGFTDSDVNLSNMIGTMSMESESDLGDSMEVPQLDKAAPGESTPGRGRPFSLRVMLKFPVAGKQATGNSPTKNDNHKSSPPATTVIASSNSSVTPRKRGRPRKAAAIAVPVFPVVVLTELAQDNPTRRSQRRTCKNELRPEPSVAQGDKNNNSSVDDEVEEQVRDERDGARATEKVDPMDEGSDSEGEAELEQKMDFLTRRALNIKENKAMLARLMADLKTMPGLMGKFSVQSSTPSHKARRPPKAMTPGLSDGPVRRNPERSTRTNTRSLGLRASSSPPSSPHRSLEERLRYKRKSSDSDDDGDDEYRPHRRRGGFCSTSAILHVVRSVDEITQDELTLIAASTSDKSYDKVNGSTCHQCRQKTSDTKTCCRNPECWGVRGQFCGPCLRNRYGEDVRAALLDPAWHCPICRGICNCSFCRRREGRCATGILIHLAKYHGYNNAQAYLESLQKEIDDED